MADIPMRLKREPHIFTSTFVTRVFVVDETLLNNIAEEKMAMLLHWSHTSY